MSRKSFELVVGNASDSSVSSRGWFVGHFMPEASPLYSRELEVKWTTHAKGETRPEWAPSIPSRTLNILVRGKFALLFPDREIVLEKEGDFALFGPGIPHSFRALEESLVATVRWPSLSPAPAGRDPTPAGS